MEGFKTCGACGVPVAAEHVELHIKWHNELNEKLNAIYESLTGLYNISDAMTKPL